MTFGQPLWFWAFALFPVLIALFFQNEGRRVKLLRLLVAARLQPLAPADLGQAGMTSPLCDFSRDGRMLLAVSSPDAIARIAGLLLHFAHSSPAGPTETCAPRMKSRSL